MASCVVCASAASIYCTNDAAFLCHACDLSIHSSNVLAQSHKRTPLCSVCKHTAATVYCKNDFAYLCAQCDVEGHRHALGCTHERVTVEQAQQQEQAHLEGLADSTAVSETSEASHRPDPAAVPMVPPGIELPSNPVAKDTLAKSLWGNDFQAFDLDNTWLDRLDMGFDFTDILEENSDGLVPSMSPTAAEAAMAGLTSSFAADALDMPPLPEDFCLGDDKLPSPSTSGLGTSSHMAASMGMEAPSMSMSLTTLPEPLAPALHQVAVPPPPPPPPRAPRAAHMNVPATSEPPRRELSIPNSEGLTREQRVQRYLEKKRHRKFEKKIRYASRKAYAEVRPRIKGRFAKREEVAAWRAAEAAMRGTSGDVMESNDMVVPCM